MEHTGTILIVDDEPVGRETLEGLLASPHYQLVFASSGTEALSHAQTISPDLVLLDVMMPGMDGFEVCRRLRASPPLSEVPILLVTALDDRDSRLEGIAAGADDFITKPFDRAELRLRVRTIMRLNRYRRLMNERARFEQLIHLSPDGFLIANPEGTIHLANPAIARILRADTAEALIGRNMRTFVEQSHHARCESCLTSVLSTPSYTVCLEIVVLRTDGTSVPIEIHIGQVRWEACLMVQMIARDITERKEAEAENLLLLQKLAERERRLQDLVEKLLVSQEEERRRVACELHDGLAQVASGAYQHLQTFASHYHSHDSRFSHELDRALDLSQRVVKEARQVIAGMRPTVLDDFGLASALRMEVDILRADGWDISYEEATTSDRLPSTIETAFFRVAQEALTNVRKHANTRRARLALHYDEHTIRLDVQDWGCGFDRGQLTETGSGGEHIGLIGMEERITLLGGELRITSQPGSGTLLVAEVPMPSTKDNDPADEADEAAALHHESGPARLLIADDHELARAGLRSMLQGEAELNIVAEATNGREALELCQKLQPHVALLDVRMPEMDGLHATRAIKQSCPHTSVIIVTMHENPDYLLAAIRAGAAGYLLKDTVRRELLSAVRNVLRGEQFLNTDLTRRLLQTMSDETVASEAALPEPLTPREIEVLHLLTLGDTNREIARKLFISAGTVKVHVQHIIAKLGVSDRTQAAVRAVELGLLRS